MENLEYTRRTSRSQPEVVAAIGEAAVARGFRVLHTHQVHETLAEKGFTIPAYSIVEVCNARYAHAVLTTHAPVGMFLPCRFAVYTEGAETVVSLMRPSLIADLMPGKDFGGIPREVEEVLVAVVDDVAA